MTWRVGAAVVAALLTSWLVVHSAQSRDGAAEPTPRPTPVVIGVQHPATPPQVWVRSAEPAEQIEPCPWGKVLVHFAEGYACVSTAPPEPAQFVSCDQGTHAVQVPVSRDYPEGIACRY